MSVLFNQTSPIECYKLNIIACFCILILILSLFFNFSLLIIFARFKKLRTNPYFNEFGCNHCCISDYNQHQYILQVFYFSFNYLSIYIFLIN